MTRRVHFLLLATLVIAQLALGHSARAQSKTNLEKLSAEALFASALQLMRSGEFDSACPKLEESQRLDPGLGTLLYLADCYRSQGKTASAWMTFREAAFLAKKAGESDRERIALHHAEELRPTLMLLEFQLKGSAPALQIELDGNVISSEMMNVPFPVDPGRHAIVASAPGYDSWEAETDVSTGPGREVVKIPSLVKTASPSPQPVAPDPRNSVQEPWSNVGWILTGTGALALLGAGVVYAANSEQWMAPALLGTAGLFTTTIGVVIIVPPATEKTNAAGSAIPAQAGTFGLALRGTL